MLDLFNAGERQRFFQGLLDIGSGHCGGERPSQDIARVVINNGREIVPTPANDLELREIGLPELIDAPGRMLELLG
jgi:hypothetical protein